MLDRALHFDALVARQSLATVRAGEANSRLNMNDPPTAVGGISAF
jgi:hypothetical protein